MATTTRPTAAETYHARAHGIAIELQDLEQQLGDHEALFRSTGERSWCAAADLQGVEDALRELREFLGYDHRDARLQMNVDETIAQDNPEVIR